MPQLDHYIFASTLPAVILSTFILLYFITNHLFPRISSLLKLRHKWISKSAKKEVSTVSSIRFVRRFSSLDI